MTWIKPGLASWDILQLWKLANNKKVLLEQNSIVNLEAGVAYLPKVVERGNFSLQELV